MPQDAPDVVVAGHICLDIIPDAGGIRLASAGEFFRPGTLRTVGPAAISTGGPVSNTGLGLVKLGVATALMGKVGCDPLGELVRRLLAERWGIHEGLITDPGATTSYTVAICPPGFDRMFLHCTGANDTFTADDIDYDLVARARLFHLGYPPVLRRLYEDEAAGLIDVFRRVKALGVTTSLDMSLPDPATPGAAVDWQAVLARLIPHVDFFLPSAEEAMFMLDRDRYGAGGHAGLLDRLTGDDVHDLTQRVLDMGGKVVGVKSGHRGMALRTAGADSLAGLGRARPGDAGDWATRELWAPAFQIDTPPTATGSGDSAIAGFLAAYLRGYGAEKALRCANAAGAYNVMAPDALSGLRPWEELVAAVEAGWATQPLAVEGEGWSAGADGLWRGPAERSQPRPDRRRHT
jgi:sugar/nucleoside kinase (ribokinase family)